MTGTVRRNFECKTQTETKLYKTISVCGLEIRTVAKNK